MHSQMSRLRQMSEGAVGSEDQLFNVAYTFVFGAEIVNISNLSNERTFEPSCFGA